MLGTDLYEILSDGNAIAKDMPIEVAIIAVKALMCEYHYEPELEYSIRRQSQEGWDE